MKIEFATYYRIWTKRFNARYKMNKNQTDIAQRRRNKRGHMRKKDK
jgi:hypothetical protein